MKVRELIEELQKCDHEGDVSVYLAGVFGDLDRVDKLIDGDVELTSFS